MIANIDAPRHQSRELLSFRVRDQRYCVDVMDVRELRGWTKVTPLPHAPDYICGVINLRGSVLPIVDLGARFRLGHADPMPRHVVIVVEIDGKLTGLLVDSVCDILTVAPEEVQAPPEAMGGDIHGLINGLLTIDGSVIGLVKLSAVVPPPESVAA
jgi:purine-binding chemotaxis protein CheW